MISKLSAALILLTLLFTTTGCSPRGVRNPGWIKLWGATAEAEFNQVTADEIAIASDDSIYIVGEFTGSIDFDPDDEEKIIEAVDRGVYLSKFSSRGDLEWTLTWGPTTDYDIPCYSYPKISILPNGNLLIAGIFSGEWDFDPGSGLIERTSDSESGMYVLQLDEDGVYQSVLTWLETGSVFSWEIETDSSGSIYLAGGFSGQVDFIPGGDHRFINSEPGEGNFFVGKYFQSGELQWIKIWSGGHVFDLKVDSGGEIYLAGWFMEEFNPDPDDLTSTITPYNERDSVLVKLDTEGNFSWFKTHSSNLQIGAWNITVDDDGNFFSAGVFEGEVDFNSGSEDDLLSCDGITTYIEMYDATTNFQWVRAFEGINLEQAFPGTLAIWDEYVCVAGVYNGYIDFDPSDRTANRESEDIRDGYVSMFETDGSFRWVSSIGSDNEGDSVNGVAFNSRGKLYAVGMVDGNAYLARFRP